MLNIINDILIISTGGTFNKRYNELTGELDIFNSIDSLNKFFEKSFKSTFSIKTIIDKDSLFINNYDRSEIVELIKKSNNFNKIIIIHGTDTMDETASFLNQHINDKKIVLTGSMCPFSISESESISNISMAIGFLNNSSLKNDIYISMHGLVDTFNCIIKDRKNGIFIKK
jgi:L-asparaginase